MLDQINRTKIFSRLDLKSGYHQIRIKDDDVVKTVCRTRHGSLEFIVLLFGLTNAPSIFMRLINLLLYISMIFQFIGNHLYINTEECEFGVDHVGFIEHIVTSHGIKVDDNKLIAIKNWPI
ncbi:unnamed protein product [Adineta steineri]|uniref:Reverse transcriptase domain-containing protein n=1 Tax=Adineta steineri TaxID=433720 RepID=A0A813RJA5_9BILA|nr:unnamed protein product [Adineta steineri]